MRRRLRPSSEGARAAELARQRGELPRQALGFTARSRTAATRAFTPDADLAEPREKSDDESEAMAFLSPPGRADSLGRIGHYEVLQILGRGGFGIVFRAFDDILQRVVAVKVMAPQLASTSPARKRFLREAQSSAQVRHENVVQVYEVGEKPLPHLVMEFIPGETLQQRLDRTGPLDVAETVRIGRQIAEGLAAAHATDLIHRDIKPGNVLIERGQYRVKITDFGLARAADDASISQSGIIAGTPMYMAPEQALGHKLDQRADLFSLGSVLYQMVAGRPPFRANSTLAVLKRVAEDTPRSIREIVPETPQWLCDIIAKLHEKNPDERFQSAREVADVLADCETQLKTNSKVKDLSRIPKAKAAFSKSGSGKMVATAGIVVFSLVGLIAVIAGLFFRGHKANPKDDSLKPAVVSWGEIVDPLGDCTVAETNGRLTLRVPGDGRHDLNPTPGWNLNAPRVLREFDGDFDVAATVLPFPRPIAGTSARADGTCYVGAGLVVMAGEGSVLRLFRTGLHSNRDGAPYVEAEWFNGGPARQQKAAYVTDGALHLRIQRIGTELRLSHNSDGRQWSKLHTVTDLAMGQRVMVGAAAGFVAVP